MAPPQYPPTSPPPQLLITPLMVSMIGIIAAAIAITTYHFIVSKYCVRHQPSPSEPTTALQSSKGVDKKILESIPIRAYEIEPIGSFQVKEIECVVCLGELEDGDPIRLLPSCNHAFHLECIDQWFYSHSNCPLCRSPVDVGPTTTDKASFSGPHLIISQPDIMSNEFVAGTGLNPGSFKARIRSKGLLRPCASLVMPINKKPQVTIEGLKRSLSMDSCYDSVKISSKYLQQNSSLCSSSSSSSNVACSWINSFKGGSFKRLDHTSSAMMKSFSLLRISHNSSSESRGRLPV